MKKNPYISQAVKRIGGFTETARITGANGYQTVQQWIVTGSIPAKYCLAVEAASGISRYKLRPADGHLIWPELKETANAQ